MTKLRIAIAQTAPVVAPEGPAKLEKPHSTSPFSTIDHNLLDAISYVEKAVSQKAEVVIFPEYFLQGIVNEGRQVIHGTREEGAASVPDSNPFSHIPTDTKSKPTTHITSAQLEWAKYLETHPLSSEENAGPKLYNTAFFIDDRGEIPGEEEHKVFDTKWGKAGMMICWDMSHPAHAQELANQGADIIFAPTFWYATDSEPMIHKYDHDPEYENHMVQSLCFARCIETETVWVMCNAGGDPLEGFMGGSGVWVPLRGKVASCDVAAKLEVVEIDLSVLKDSRKTYKVREDAAKRLAT
ncbi:uncharacterized protein L201_007373 [Kwoniella dendrophila CBS 6074]|uniref:CN hydrolase domain-containing protein n=1 Tax=Kwoniella dendrophila CBS 6074 TaxID=1295534 RepID=A0AAX4K3V8_9TREE